MMVIEEGPSLTQGLLWDLLDNLHARTPLSCVIVQGLAEPSF